MSSITNIFDQQTAAAVRTQKQNQHNYVTIQGNNRKAVECILRKKNNVLKVYWIGQDLKLFTTFTDQTSKIY